MSEDSPRQMTREERLAAKLRENLRRRKSQAREMAGSDTRPEATDSGDPLPKGESGR